jgi:hypothetical protein
MNSISRQVRLFVFVVLILSCTTLSRAETSRFSIGTGVDYRTGDYGTDDSFDSFTIPVILNYYPSARFDFEVFIPYLYQSSSTTVLAGGDRVISVDRNGRGRRATSTTTEIVETTEEDVESSESGLGDISLTAGYTFLHQDGMRPNARLYAYLKIPTADEDKGLGTGKFDYGAGLELSAWKDFWYGKIAGGGVFQGEHADWELKDYATFEGELGRQFTNRVYGSLSAWGATEPSEDSSSLLEIRINNTLWLSSQWSAESYLGKGLTSGSADFSAGIKLYRHF